jgi:hypothetical protein
MTYPIHHPVDLRLPQPYWRRTWLVKIRRLCCQPIQDQQAEKPDEKQSRGNGCTGLFQTGVTKVSVQMPSVFQPRFLRPPTACEYRRRD